MSPVRYYKLCLGLPLLAPVLVIAISALVAMLTGLGTFPSIFGLVVMSLFIGGIPYVLTIIPLFWYGWNREASWYRNLSFVLPLIYAVVLVLSYFVFLVIRTKSFRVLSGEHVELVLAQAGLLVGYPYVGLCHLGLFVLRRLGVIKEI